MHTCNYWDPTKVSNIFGRSLCILRLLDKQGFRPSPPPSFGQYPDGGCNFFGGASLSKQISFTENKKAATAKNMNILCGIDGWLYLKVKNIGSLNCDVVAYLWTFIVLKEAFLMGMGGVSLNKSHCKQAHTTPMFLSCLLPFFVLPSSHSPILNQSGNSPIQCFYLFFTQNLFRWHPCLNSCQIGEFFSLLSLQLLLAYELCFIGFRTF